MNRLSVKARVTIWYTGLVLALAALGVFYLFAFSGQVSTQELRTSLQNIVTDVVKQVRFTKDGLDEDDIDFYKENVSIFLYDTQGRLLAPKINRGIQVDSLLEDQKFKKVSYMGEDWMVYDLYAVRNDQAFWVRGIISLEGIARTLRGMLLLALIAVPIFGAVAALGGWMITRRAFAAVGRMAQTADAINSGSDLSRRIEVSGSEDEFAQLGRAINTMLSRLQTSFENERQFTSDASHELRTPAAAIISQCEYALSQAAGPEEREECLKAILRQSRRMSGLISQLLMLARADSGRFQFEREPIDLGMICEMSAAELQEEARKAQVVLETQLAEDVIVEGDETMLIRLVINLVSNAIRYNRPGGRVNVLLESDGRLTVSDTGIGIEPDQIDKIWNRFYRADPSRSKEGTGLGLSMARWIVQQHGAQISVQSARGVGSVFSVQFPIEK